MGRWTQYDEDDYRLPEGFKRVAYDADTGKYTYQDTSGREWRGAPHQTYGAMLPTGRVHQPATTSQLKHRTSSFISLDGPWTSITKEMAESGLSPEELSANPMHPGRRSTGLVQSAKKLAKRIRSLSVSAGADADASDDDDGRYTEKQKQQGSSGTTTERGRKGPVASPPTPQSHSTLKRSFSTTAASSQKAPPMTRRSSVSKESTTATGTTMASASTLRPSKTISHPQGSGSGSGSGRARPPPASSAAISRTLAYALGSTPPKVPPKDRSSHHRRVVSDSPISHTSPRSQSSQLHSHHSPKSGSGPTIATTSGKPGRKWKNQEERERERIEKERDKEKGTASRKDDSSRDHRVRSSSRAPNANPRDGHRSETMDKTPIYARFSSEGRNASLSRHHSVKV